MSEVTIKIYHDRDIVRVTKTDIHSQEARMFTLSAGQSAEVTVGAPLTVQGRMYSDEGKVTDAVAPVTGPTYTSMISEQQKMRSDFDVNSADSVFMKGVKQAPEVGPREILNWYRNLYYKEPQHTERGCLACAINEVLKLVKEEEAAGNAKN